MTPLPGARAMTCPQGGWMQRTQSVMGTPVNVQLWAADRVRGSAAMAAVITEMQRIARGCSLQRADSELSRVNAAAAEGPVRISHELFQLLARAREFSRLTQGAFDVTHAGAPDDPPAGGAADDAGPLHAVQSIGWRHLLLDPVASTLRFARQGVRVELGGFVNGHAVDRCCALLQRHAIVHAVVSAGGASRMLGDRRGQPWTAAVHNPQRGAGVLALLPVRDAAVSTSGDRDGPHSRPEPACGRPSPPPRSVTVVAPDGLTAEALGRAVRVLGVERGLALIGQQPGVDAVVVDAGGELHVTRRFEALRPAADRAQCAA